MKHLLVVLAVVVMASDVAFSQELEPRAYTASPVGTSFVVLGLSRSAGGVLSDPTLPVTDIDAGLNAATIGLGRTFSLFGRLALATTALPYSWGKFEGLVAEEARKITRSGLADLRAKVSVNLTGPRALRISEFVKAPRSTIVGASLSLNAPTGQYYPSKLVNLGTNRWAFKPEVGISYPAGRWDLEAYGGVWMFTTNDRFYTGDASRSQDPIVAIQTHVAYTFRSRAWIAGDATWYSGGSASVTGGQSTQRQNNSRLGATISLPLGLSHSVKLAYSTGASTRVGSDFNTVAAVWQRVWIAR